MKVGFDATPLLGPRTGIGTYTERLVQALVETTTDAHPPLELVATPFSWRGTEPLRAQLPDTVSITARRVPARALWALWTRAGWPPVELLSGTLDVFHGTNFLAPPSRRAGTVVTVHDLAYLELPETVSPVSLAYRHLVPAALARGAVVCAVSETMGAALRQTYSLPRERVVVTPLGVDESWFSVPAAPPPRLGLPAQYVVAVGTLEPRKNLKILVDAYRLAGARGDDLPPLVLVGAEGWGDQLDITGIAPGRILRTGHLPFPDLQRVVAGADLLAFPSRYEGFGLPPLEALATGTAVVATDLPVTREVLGDQAGFVDTSTAEAVLDGLDAGLVRAAGTADSRRARARTFTWARCATATLQAYRMAA